MEASVQPHLLRWARERSSLSPDTLAKKMGFSKPERVIDWERTGKLSLKHLQKLAEKTHTPLGYLFLSEPPHEELPISDFRTHNNQTITKVTADLLDTIYACQERQAWYREWLLAHDATPLSFVSSFTVNDPIEAVASDIRNALGKATSERGKHSTWEQTFKALSDQIEALGILVMRNGVVGNNTHRKLNPDEFRGFALSDEYAPLIFVNNADFNAAKMFTLIHECTHIWLGLSGVSDLDTSVQPITIERYCNKVAASVLVPLDDFARRWRPSLDTMLQIKEMVPVYKVSTLVLLFRAFEAGYIGRDELQELVAAEREKFSSKNSSGGDFYNTSLTRLGKRFTQAVVASTLEGRTLYRTAFRLLDVSNPGTFNEIAQRTTGLD